MIRAAAGVSAGLGIALIWLFILILVHPMTAEQAATEEFLAGGDAELPFGPDETAHMHDVRSVLDDLRIVATVTFILGMIGLSMGPSAPVLRVAGWLLILVPVLLAILPWNVVFEFMHQVLFPQGNWTFPITSSLIQTYPPSFFIGFSLAWGALCVASGALLLNRRRAPA